MFSRGTLWNSTHDLIFPCIRTRLKACVYTEKSSHSWDISQSATRNHCITSIYPTKRLSDNAVGQRKKAETSRFDIWETRWRWTLRRTTFHNKGLFSFFFFFLELFSRTYAESRCLFYASSSAAGMRRVFSFSFLFERNKNILHHFHLSQFMATSTLPILAVCRTRVI